MYQRDDWRGIAHTLAAPRVSRVIVGEQFASLPLSVYMGYLHSAAGASVTVREVDFVALRQRRSAQPPLPPVVPAAPPPGFTAVGVRRTPTYAVARFVAARPTAVSVGLLRREQGEARASVILQG